MSSLSYFVYSKNIHQDLFDKKTTNEHEAVYYYHSEYQHISLILKINKIYFNQ